MTTIASAQRMIDIAHEGFFSVETLLVMDGVLAGFVMAGGGIILMAYKTNWTLNRHLDYQRESKEASDKRQQKVEERQEILDERQKATDRIVQVNTHAIKTHEREIDKLNGYISESHQTNKMLSAIINKHFNDGESYDE